MNQNYYIYKNEKILINVSGMHFETWSWTLARFPKTLLGDPNKRKKYFDYIHNEYFFERHRQSFESILYYYQSNGRFLIRPMSVSSEVFFDEIVFFELGEEVINKYKRDEGYMIDKEANMSDLPTNRLKRWIWLLFEYPHSSIFARLVAVISVVVVVVSITIFCVETLPDVKARRTAIASGGGGGGSSSISGLATTTSISSSTPFLVTSSSPSYTSSSSTSSSSSPSSSLSAIIFSASSSSSPSFSSSMTPSGITSSRPPTSLQDDKNRSFPLMTSTQVAAVSKIKDEFFVIESICIIWFSIELVMRFYSAPNRLKFAKQFGNIIDFLSILPYFMETTDTSAKFSFLRIIRLVRVFRIFKLARHFKGLQILAHTLKASLNELMLLMFFLVIGVVLFSSIVYYTELDDSKSDFHSIPDGFWYAIITMTTVGYGEIVPKTTLGKLIGCFCAIAGVLTIALPVPIIVSHFQYFSRSNETLKKVNKETLRASNNLRANSNGSGSGAAQLAAKTDSLGRRCSSIASGSYGLGEFIEMRNKTSTASTPVASNNCTRRPSRIITNRV